MKTVRKQRSMEELQQDSWLSGGSESWLEGLYESWLKNPAAATPEWETYFQQIAPDGDVSHAGVRDFFLQLPRLPRKTTPMDANTHRMLQQEKLVDLITAYRSFGYLQADIDPLGMHQGVFHPSLALSWHGFSETDLNAVFDTGSFTALNRTSATLGEILSALQKIYCGTIGIEYMQISTQEEVDWIQQRMESDWLNYSPSVDEKKRILDRLVVADGLEKYIGLKYVGQKRFSLEGGDSLIPMLDTILHSGADRGIKEIVIGMAHRGRLNVLINVLGKTPASVFAGFQGKHQADNRSGDVKYHLGFSSDVSTSNGPIHLALAFNPSHLEIVAPVVQGSVRSRQRRRKDSEHALVMPIQIHGDAAFAAQGVVMETFCLSQTRWFLVGGSIHIVINNQIGFTISDPHDARSSRYCTDIARMVEAPVLHVNGNDPEAVCFAARLAVDYRTRFKKDIVIDLVCYRRHGHNEADEPTATQPMMYRVIRSLPPPCSIYADRLVQAGLIDKDTEQQMFNAYRDRLDQGDSVVELANGDLHAYEYAATWAPFEGTDWTVPAKTAVSLDQLNQLARQLETLPPGFVLQAQVQKMLEARIKMTEGNLPLNWGYAETLAYATLLVQGYPIRLCGQDACRGTFFHRHAVLHDQNSGEIYIPLSHLAEGQSQINLIDSLLSEEAVLAFEYGYASAEPNYLTIWEAQFGDFANGAQVVIDQFISSGEQKWGRLCGLVVNLPHGYEGQGPEHSSARLERYLQLCAQDNMQVCVPTTPAQVFHMLRRQMIRPWRKPLIVMTPKSLLRHPQAMSTLAELSDSEFHLVIGDASVKPDAVTRIIFCSGKVYYDLLEKRDLLKLSDVAIVRVEQLYPFPEKALQEILAEYSHIETFVWCQEEPENQGAWSFIQGLILSCLPEGEKLTYAGRASSAAPAVGYFSVHQQEQEALVADALGKSLNQQ